MKKSPLLPIFLIVVVDVLGLSIIMPLLAFYAEHFGASPSQVGFLVSSYAICQLVAGPILGQISDHTGRKPLLVVSQIGTFIGFLILAFAQSLPMVFLSRIIDGLTAGNLSLAQAYISDVTEPQNRARAFGVIGVAFGLGFLIGPAISGFLSQFGYQYPIFAAAALSATSVLATLTLLPKTTPAHQKHHHPEAEEVGPGGRRLNILSWSSYARYFREPQLSVLLVQFFCFCLSFAGFTGGFALFAERRLAWHGQAFGAKEVGYFFAFTGFLGVFIQGGLIGRLVKKFGERKLVVAGFIASALGYFGLGLTYTVPVLLAVATVSSFGHGVLRPTLTSLITQSVSRREQGVVLGLNQSLMSVAQIFAPVLAGYLIQHGMLTSWAWVSGLSCLIALSLLLRSRHSHHAQPA